MPRPERGQLLGSGADEAAGLECLGYGTPAIMRLPGRFLITWEDDETLRIDTDYGTQTRLFHFGATTRGEPSGRGTPCRVAGCARWRRGLKAVTDNLMEGYIRKNGAPYSGQTVVTEYYDIHSMPNGDTWLNVTTHVVDPVYFSRPSITTTDFKKLPGDDGWTPTPCSVR